MPFVNEDRSVMKSFASSLLAVALAGPVLAAPTLTGRTASGRDVFAEGERPELHLTVTGLKPDIAGPDVLVEVFVEAVCVCSADFHSIS